MRYPQFLTAGRSPPLARSILKSNNLEHAELQQLMSLMERFGATKTELATGNLLKDMVGTRRLELLTSTVSSTGGHLKRLRESQDTIIEPLSNPRFPLFWTARRGG